MMTTSGVFGQPEMTICFNEIETVIKLWQDECHKFNTELNKKLN